MLKLLKKKSEGLIMKFNIFLKIISLLVSILIFATACATKENFNESSITNISSKVNSSPSASLISSTSESCNDILYNDLLSEIQQKGKTVTALGDLTNTKYKNDLLELNEILNSYSREISLVAYSLNNKKAVYYNTEASLFCACTVKAAYSLFACKEMDKGNGSLETVMTYEKKHYEPGTGDMQYKSFGTSFKMETIIDKSMRISDNVGYLMMVDYFGRDKYNNFIGELGCSSLQIKPTVWSLKAKAKDLAFLWREIYKYFKQNQKHSEFLYNSCTNTPDNYATLALGDIDYSHKQGHNNTADWPAYSDAGIVWGENPYIIVILTNSLGPNDEVKNTIAKAIKIINNKLFK